ncbi:Integration host factor [uncultured Desulfobacterium sp.]|uniref:Viral histone-like protein n=1 Tax=uncultured Desulfobacterium sp. TaxID=201089 RepID=A0A445MYL0_9BACT|nr:Integration host factor [uncultured Desulfobacterium sp.]
MAAKKAVKKESANKAKAKKEPAQKKQVQLKSPMTKASMITEISQSTGLNKKQVNSVLDELSGIIDRHIKKRGPGKFILPGLIKIQVKQKPATKARKGVNPFTGQETVFKAKPARRVVKVSPLKKLKGMAE